MGLLDDVIGAALGSRSTASLSSPIAMALMALLASRLGSGAGAQQGTPGGLSSLGGPGGLGALIEQFRRNGFEDVINSWLGNGQNQAISTNQLRQALGQDTVDHLSRQSGLAHDDLLAQLSKMLPGVIDKLTPNGQIPNEGELLPGPR
jgi:uncharacterized protein YidB (DUF937 family)